MYEKTQKIVNELERLFDETAREEVSNWTDREIKASILIQLGDQINRYEKRMPDQRNDDHRERDAEYQVRKQEEGEQNLVFWQGFVDYAYQNEAFAKAFKPREAAAYPWLLFNFNGADPYALKAFYNNRSHTIEITFQFDNNLDLYRSISDRYPIRSRETRDGIRYTFTDRTKVNREDSLEEIYKILADKMLEIKSMLDLNYFDTPHEDPNDYLQ